MKAVKADKATPGLKLAPLPNNSPELSQLLQRDAINALNEFKDHLQARGCRFLFPAHFLSSLYKIADDEVTGFKFEANSTDFDEMIEVQKMREEQNTEPEPDEPIVMKPPSKDTKQVNIQTKNKPKNISGFFH